MTKYLLNACISCLIFGSAIQFTMGKGFNLNIRNETGDEYEVIELFNNCIKRVSDPVKLLKVDVSKVINMISDLNTDKIATRTYRPKTSTRLNDLLFNSDISENFWNYLNENGIYLGYDDFQGGIKGKCSEQSQAYAGLYVFNKKFKYKANGEYDYGYLIILYERNASTYNETIGKNEKRTVSYGIATISNDEMSYVDCSDSNDSCSAFVSID